MDRPGHLLDLPAGFTCVVVQRADAEMSDGHPMPPQPDGMFCFSGPDGRWVLLRNHELGDDAYLEKYSLSDYRYVGQKVPRPCVEEACFGGVSRVVLDPRILMAELKGRGPSGGTSAAIVRSHMVLAGTDKNCAGGTVPEGWVSCEESSRPGHGYPYLTRPEDDGLVAPRPIRSWGRFHREAIALEPETGVVYMTEDRADGCFYRHVPEDVGAPLGPGRLQALSIPGLVHTDPYPEPNGVAPSERIWPDGHTWDAVWVDIEDPDAALTSCRSQGAAAGATAFSRGEGIARAREAIWFTASTGGALKGGQIFRYQPGSTLTSAGRLTLEMEVWDRSSLSCPDNIALAPWGDLVLAEDNYDRSFGVEHQYLRGLTEDGQIYDLARNRHNGDERGAPGAEFTGACFSPDGSVLFVNLQRPQHLTLAIWGPWGS